MHPLTSSVSCSRTTAVTSPGVTTTTWSTPRFWRRWGRCPVCWRLASGAATPTFPPTWVRWVGLAHRSGPSATTFGAAIYGADVDERALFAEPSISTFHVDQTDLSSVERLGDHLPDRLDLVIDDGLHSPNANLAVLLLGLDKVHRGGWIVIEDIAPAAAAMWEQSQP